MYFFPGEIVRIHNDIRAAVKPAAANMLEMVRLSFSVFSSHEHGVLSELLWSLTVRRCPSVRPTSVRPQFAC